MSALQIAAPSFPSLGLPAFLARLRADEPRFFGAAVLMLAAMAPTAFAALADGRTFLGIDVWTKPLKFETALAIYLLTLAFFARWLPAAMRAGRRYRIYSSLVVAAIVLEMIWIGGAAMLGTASHFNGTPAGMIIYSAMGAAAVLLTTPTAVYAWSIARNPAIGLPPAIREAVVTGLALTLPLTLVTAGTMSSMAGHAVGGSGLDTGGLPLMGWARDAGDLRVAHFFSTHALHVIPVFGVVSAALFGPTNRLPVRLFSLAYIGFVMWVFIQALMGEPFLLVLG